MRTFEEGGSICRIISCVDNDRIYYKIETGNDTAHFSDLSEEEQKIVLEWLQWNVWPAKNKLDGHSSYGMKHILNNRTGIYITNNQMKEAMWNLGFRPTKINTLNWTFKIKKSSPIFQRQIMADWACRCSAVLRHTQKADGLCVGGRGGHNLCEKRIRRPVAPFP